MKIFLRISASILLILTIILLIAEPSFDKLLISILYTLLGFNIGFLFSASMYEDKKSKNRSLRG